MTRRSVFISYAHADRPDVQASADLLRAGGVKIFIDIRDIEFGDRWQNTLKRALDQCERVLVFWSDAARASEWVEHEWRYALTLGKRIVPTLLDATPLPAELGAFQALPRFRSGMPMQDPRKPGPVDAGGMLRSRAWVGTGVAVASLGLGGAALFAWHGMNSGLPPGQTIPVTPAPGPAASAAPVPAPTSDPVPSPPPTAAPASGPAVAGLDEAIRAARRASSVVTAPASDMRAITSAAQDVARLLASTALQPYTADELRLLRVEVVAARRSVLTRKGLVAAGQASAAAEEAAPLDTLALELAAAEERITRRLEVVEVKPSSTEVLLDSDVSTLPVMVGGGAALVLALVWLHRRRRAAAFVREVFEL